MFVQAKSPQAPTAAELPERAVMKVEAFLQWAGISRFLFYQEVKRGHIRPKKCGGRTMIPVQEAERWLRDLPELLLSNRPEEG